MTTLDLQSGYYQVRVPECNKDKTAFITPFGVYRFKRMSFGLKNASSAFQHLIDRFRAGLGDIRAFAHLDDLIILSETFEGHPAELELVLQRLVLFKLRVNRKKSVFACSEVRYLGHIITPGGIKADPDKTASKSNLPQPRNVKHLKSFVQTCFWYRKFVPRFTDVARPLTDLLKKNVKWKWGEKQQSAFQHLKELLTTPLKLKQADETQPYILNTNASEYAIGRVLLQETDDEEHPVECASRLLIPAERPYCTTEREALAVVYCLSKFRGYVECSEVQTISRCAS